MPIRTVSSTPEGRRIAAFSSAIGIDDVETLSLKDAGVPSFF
jgi:hypothetical protein